MGQHPENVTEEAPRLKFVARQPILDLQRQVHGYELLYRDGLTDHFLGDRDHACRVTLDNTLLFSMGKLTGNAIAFVNCTHDVLVERLVTVLPPKAVVLEIMETVSPDSEVIRACNELREMGYKFALDDFDLRLDAELLIPLADYIKIDFLSCPPNKRQIIRKKIADARVSLVAEKVESQAEFANAVQEGFEYFQGFYFCRPELMATREIPVGYQNYLSLLRALGKEPLELREVEALVKRDASLCFRLLRLVNSALMGLKQEITSVMAALLTIGDQQFRKLAWISLAAQFNGAQPAELLVMAFSRGRFCELNAAYIGENPDEQYLLGLFSLFPAILRLDVEDIIPTLPFRKEIIAALRQVSNSERILLSCVEEYERGNWQKCSEYCDALHIPEPLLAANYLESVCWAREALSLI